VDVDNRAGAKLAARHLLDLGHRRIGLVLGPQEYEHVTLRRAAFLEELAHEGVKHPARYVLDKQLYATDPIVESYIVELLRGEDRPTALLSSSDSLAHAALRVAQTLGIRVPEELSIVGFDDAFASESSDVRLTTVRQPLFEMGEASALRLIDRIEASGDERVSISSKPIVFAPELIVRGSTSVVSSGS
jgi:LacI family transcriptional regulator